MRPCLGLTSLLLLSGCASPPPPVPPPPKAPGPRILIGSTLDCGRLITQLRPVYPKEANKKHIEGTVQLRALISKTGEVRTLEVLKGHPLLVPAALTAVKQWRYTPCLLNSEPVEVRTQIDVNFNVSQ